jgi:hypothetical protein
MDTLSNWTTVTLKLQNVIKINQAKYVLLYIFDCKSDEMHMDFLCILYYTVPALQHGELTVL